MKSLFDTNLLAWLADGGAVIRPGERAVIAARDEVPVAAISLGELKIRWRLRHRSGARKGPVSPEQAFAYCKSSNIPVVGFDAHVAMATLDPPVAHNDPFDELLLTQAQEGGYRLLTRDAGLGAHPVALVP